MFHRALLRLVLVAVWSLAAVQPGWGAMNSVRLVPTPQQVTWSESEPIQLGGKKVAIVIGDKASEPEKYAAERFQQLVAKRFGLQWPVVTEKDPAAAADVAIVLGQRNTNGRVAELCKQNRIKLGAKAPGFDGYVLEMIGNGARTAILVGGCNARGVIYGQDTLFQLLKGDGEKVTAVRASIRDYPSVPWRGRPQTNVRHYFREGELDCFTASRINFADLREGIYAHEPGAKLDKPLMRKTLAEAHRRGLIMYGIVNCGVSGGQYAKVLGTFQEYIELGVDGLWLSFDDKGPGQAPEQLVNDVLALGRQHGIRDHLIAVTPPKGSYQVIDDDANQNFNRKIMKIPGMEKALWFWTSLPTQDAMVDAERIGLKTGMSWWHNWPRLTHGFTHVGSGPVRSEGRSYTEIPSMAEGWHCPLYDQMADSGNCTAAVMPWGGNAWGQYYITPILGWWGWNPKGHDWETTRERIYEIVYGPDQIEAARTYDDLLVEAKDYLAFTWRGDQWEPTAPARLDDPAQRDKVQTILDKMEAPVARIEQGAAAQTLLSAEQCQATYVQGMRDELEAAKAIVAADFPEYWWPDYQRQILNAVYADDLAKADELAAAVRGKLLGQVAQLKEKLAFLRRVPGYAGWWTRLANLDGRGWKTLLAKRRAELAPNIWDYSYYSVKTAEMVQDFNNPPLKWATGGGRGHNRILATVLPSEREQYWGQWIGGLCEQGGIECAVFCFGKDGAGAKGGYSELPVEIPLKGHHKNLGLMFCFSSKARDRLGLELAKDRWAGYRELELWWGDKLLWHADAGRTQLDGQWCVVRLPELPGDLSVLPLRLKIVEKQRNALEAIVFVSAFRLVEMGHQLN